MTRTVTKAPLETVGGQRMGSQEPWESDLGVRRHPVGGESSQMPAMEGAVHFKACSVWTRALWSEAKGQCAVWEDGRRVGLESGV